MIETKEIKMPPKKMLSILFLQNGSAAIWIALGGIIVFLVLGICVDHRFLFVVVLWLFLISPMEIAFLYFFYGMQPLTAFNTIPHRIIFNPKEIKIIFIPIEKPEQKKEDEKDSEEPVQPERNYIIKIDEYEKMKTGPDYILFFFNKKGWLWLPVSSFERYEDFKEVIHSVSSLTMPA